MDTTLIVIGVLGLLLAGFAVKRMLDAKRKLGALGASSPMTARELAALHSYGAPPGSDGAHAPTGQVVGAAQPGQAGPLTSKLSKTPCVWYRYKVTREYIDIDRDSDGDTRRTTRKETWDEGASSEAFQLVDHAGGTVVLNPAGGRPDGVEQVVDRREVKENHSGFGQLFGGDVKGGLSEIFRSDDGRTKALIYEEWVVKPGTQLFVLGGVSNGAGGVVLGKPADDDVPFIISTRSAEQIKAQQAKHQKWSTILAPVIGVAGLACLVIGIVLKVG